MDEKYCNVRHKGIEKEFERHEKWIGEHEVKIDELSKSDAINTQAIKELCAQIASLVTTIRWLIGVVVTSLIGFFIFAVQNSIFK